MQSHKSYQSHLKDTQRSIDEKQAKSDAFSCSFYSRVCQNEVALSLVFKDERRSMKNLEKRMKVFDLMKSH